MSMSKYSIVIIVKKFKYLYKYIFKAKHNSMYKEKLNAIETHELSVRQ